jgi:hypothetical protein
VQWLDSADGARRTDDREAFLAYVEQVLIPTLQPDDIVVMGKRSVKGPG